jgi:hypothetical protein
MQALHKVSDDRVISCGLWPPHSPDINPYDFFLRGYLKDKVYANKPHMSEELKREYSISGDPNKQRTTVVCESEHV